MSACPRHVRMQARVWTWSARMPATACLGLEDSAVINVRFNVQAGENAPF